MRGAFWTTLVMAAMTAAAAGCQGSVNVGGPGCPESMPKQGDACSAGESSQACSYTDGPCQVTLSCAGDAWAIDDAVCTPAAVDCWSATDDDICAVPGDSCGESDGPCDEGYLRQCGDDHHWHTSETGGGDCCSGDVFGCPAEQPYEGQPCDPCSQPQGCDYEGFCGGGTASCGADGVWHTMYSDCPPPAMEPCYVHMTSADCSLDPSCRWLVPSCMGPTIAEAGCYPAADCAPDSCDPGLTCQETTFDPCWDKQCNACSEGAFVCLP